MTTILRIEPSNRKNKRYKAILSDDRQIHFGLKGGETYLDHKDPDKRKNYIARHYANTKERKLIDNMTLSPALLSLYLLWGYYDTMEENVKYLNNKLIRSSESVLSRII